MATDTDSTRSNGLGTSRGRSFLALTCILLHAAAVTSAAQHTPAGALDAAVRRFTDAVQAEVDEGRLTGVSVALVHDQQILFAGGFGLADKERNRPATADTVYRVGSISKLFAAIAAMQLAEAGRLDIDAPVARYVPEFGIVNPFPDASEPTLRQLMCHRAGLVREAPVGSYFDDSEPSPRETVASLADCVLVHPPGTRTKYSNSGVTVVGRAVEEVSGMTFPEYQARHILEPSGMRSSAFLLSRQLRPKLARGRLSVALPEGGFREIEAPRFEFGILPAGNLYSTVEDLSRFLGMLFAEGRASTGPVLKPETLREMWTVQLTEGTNGFGLGFGLGHHRGRRTVGHTGAVYGFTSQLIGLPAEKLGVVVLACDDLAIGPVRRLTALGLDCLLEAFTGESVPVPLPALAPSPSDLEMIAGDYESQSYWARIEVEDGKVQAVISRQPFDLLPEGDLRFRGRGRLAHDPAFVFTRGEDGAVNEFTALGQTFRRVDPGAVKEIPEAWTRFIGSYGPDFIPLIVTERHGHLYAMTENEYDYRLHPVNRTVFEMPPGMYESEHLVFQVSRSGRVHGAVLANMPLPRRR